MFPPSPLQLPLELHPLPLLRHPKPAAPGKHDEEGAAMPSWGEVLASKGAVVGALIFVFQQASRSLGTITPGVCSHTTANLCGRQAAHVLLCPSKDPLVVAGRPSGIARAMCSTPHPAPPPCACPCPSFPGSMRSSTTLRQVRPRPGHSIICLLASSRVRPKQPESARPPRQLPWFWRLPPSHQVSGVRPPVHASSFYHPCPHPLHFPTPPASTQPSSNTSPPASPTVQRACARPPTPRHLSPVPVRP